MIATKFGLLETDVVLKRVKEDTILEFASTITFDRLHLNNLEIPGLALTISLYDQSVIWDPTVESDQHEAGV